MQSRPASWNPIGRTHAGISTLHSGIASMYSRLMTREFGGSVQPDRYIYCMDLYCSNINDLTRLDVLIIVQLFNGRDTNMINCPSPSVVA